MTRAAALFTALAIAAAGNATAQEPLPVHTGRVVQVIDGDSLRLENLVPDVRLWGVDAPEWNDPMGPLATIRLDRVAGGRWVACAEMDRDRYGRVVARCHLDGTREVNRMVIEQGPATEYCRFSRNAYGTCR